MDEIKTYGLENKTDQINEIFKGEIPHQITDNIRIHFSQLKGPKVTTSTVIAAIATYFKKRG